ncbi:MAG TPA: nickel-binding protein [Flavisolibacter sp.]
MPIYMDVHIVPGVKAINVAEAHRMDLLHQQEFGCNCMTYWIDEGRESIFCLIEAPSKEAVVEMHNQAHGLVPNKVIEVSSSLVQSFLGRIYDPGEVENTADGLRVFSDPSFRILMVTSTTDPVLLSYHHGAEKASQLLKEHNAFVRKYISLYDGSEVEHGGDGFIISFASAGKAVSCALAIQNALAPEAAETLGFRMSLNGGEPIERSNRLFGDTIQMAQHLCTIVKYFQVALSSSVKELVAKDYSNEQGKLFLTLPPQDEAVLESLFTKLEENWQNAEFDVDDYCRAMAMSKSQLYRKTIALTGMSPNILLKEFRLEKAKELMKKKYHSISQVTFDSGFTSPSYFTKCFKKKFGLLPMNYVELLQ